MADVIPPSTRAGSSGAPDFGVRLGQQLRQMRDQRRLTLADVERLSGGQFQITTLSAYELGQQRISWPRLEALARLYRASVRDLIPAQNRGRTGGHGAPERDSRLGVHPRLPPGIRRCGGCRIELMGGGTGVCPNCGAQT